MHIKFVGDFKTLKLNGYEFLKLYARNYICYHKEELWIWRKGKRVEIADLYGDSCLVLEYLINNNFNINNKYNIVVINRETKQIEEYNMEKHEITFIFDSLTHEEREEFYERYRKIILSNETINCLKDLYDKDLVEIC